MPERHEIAPDSAARLLVATHNPGKLQELRTLLEGTPFDLVSLPDLGVTGDVEETGSTLEENAALKAGTYASMTGVATLADDSGLEVDALGGEPGVRSSRYAGDSATDAQRIDFLLSRLGDIPEGLWTARFRCVLAIAWPHDATEYDMEYHVGECRGRIVREPCGSGGFGYDPVFLLPSLGKTMAELSTREKNEVSHRGAAARKAAAALKRRMGYS